MELKYFIFILLVTEKFIVIKKGVLQWIFFSNVLQVLDGKTVGHLGSITQPHDTSNIFISGNSLTSAAVCELSEQRPKLDKPKDMMDSKMSKINNKESYGRSKDLKIDLTMMKMIVSLSQDEDEVSQRKRSSTSQTKGHAGPAKK
jgi:hypothetical protein